MKPYGTGQSKKQEVTRMFDNIAPQYDRLDHVLSLGIDRLWRRKVTLMAEKLHPAEILDVAAGTGDLTIALARRIRGARITGSDLSQGMMSVGRRKADAAGVGERISFVVADAEQLPFADGSFDLVTAAFGVRNFQDVPAGLREMARVLRPGGTVFVLEFGMPRGKIFGPVYRFYFRRVLPVIGGMVSRDRSAYEYLPGSVGEFPAGEPFLAMMVDAGLVDCTARRLTRGVAYIYKAVKR